MAAKKSKKTAAAAEVVTPPADPKAAPAPAPRPVVPPPRTPPPMAIPASADEPTVDLSDSLAARSSPQPTVTLRFAPLSGDVEARRARESAVLVPGAFVRIQYDREPQDLGTPGNVARVEMGYSFDGGPAQMAVVADGQRNLQGILLRRAPQVSVAADARRDMQVWFRLELEDGRVLWDSEFGHNHRLAVKG